MPSPYLEQTRLPRVELVIIQNFGGMGDMLARLPALAALLRRHPHVTKVDVYWYDYFVEYARAVLSDERLVHRKMSTLEDMSVKDSKRPTIKFDPYQITSMKTHLTNIGFMFVLDEAMPNPVEMDYLPSPELSVEHLGLPEKYVVVCTGYTAPARRWPAREVHKVAAALRAQGVEPVLLGKASNKLGLNSKGEDALRADFDEDLDVSLFTDLRDKTSLLEAANVTRHAQAVVGVDNGILHLSATTDVPSIWGFTSVRPEHRLPHRGGGIMGKDMLVVGQPEKVGCRYCQSRMHFVYGHDFKKCLYAKAEQQPALGASDLWPYACVDQMKGERFIEGLKKLGVLR